MIGFGVTCLTRVTVVTSTLAGSAYQLTTMSPVPSTSDTQPTWAHQIPDEEWLVYQQAIHQARSLGIRFAFGGAFATAVYTGTFRNTKDFDFYILPADREAMRRAVLMAGLDDHFEQLPYDRSWIYRASRNGIIVDAIWAMANHRAEVDDRWLTHGPEVTIRGERLRAIPIEELIWSKLYVLQRERCDWGDVLNLVDARAETVEWPHLLNRLAQDTPLLAAVLSVFGWLSPERARDIPFAVWDRLGLDPPERAQQGISSARVDLLDSRPWFTRHAR
jgi:hypothetical protein